MLRSTCIAFVLWLTATAALAGGALRFGSAHAIVVDEASGEVLLTKNAEAAAPIASLTKLMTAMVVLDAHQDADEALRIDEADVDHLKLTHSSVRVGAQVSRGALLELALLASDNRAASALARNYPGGLVAFEEAVRRKIAELDLRSTRIEEPTGLSPNNVSSARDMARILRAAAGYAEISRITSQPKQALTIGGAARMVRNTNGLVGEPGWEILLSKTGYTNEAGRCLSMRLREAGRTVLVVLMGARNASRRTLDATNIRRWLGGAVPLAKAPALTAARTVAAAKAPRSAYRRGDGALLPHSEALAATPQEGGAEESTAASAEAPAVEREPASPETPANKADETE